MSEKPILFSGVMVRAILEGRKTVTRRLVTVPWRGSRRALPYEPAWFDQDGRLVACDQYGKYWPVESVLKPYGVPGDRLWVRETWGLVKGGGYNSFVGDYDDLDFYEIKVPKDKPRGYSTVYRCDDGWDDYSREGGAYWRPSIHMPRWASRLSLEVVTVRVERLQDVTEEDAQVEGVIPNDVPPGFMCGPGIDPSTHRGAFAMLWNEINGGRAAWETNSWVWRIEFKRLPL